MEQTAEQIAQHYTAAMDSVTLITALLEKPEINTEELAALNRNVAHLQIMLSQPYWTTQNLKPFTTAVDAGLKKISSVSPK